MGVRRVQAEALNGVFCLGASARLDWGRLIPLWTLLGIFMQDSDSRAQGPGSASAPVKTPCIGICSTTSVGDWVCRGCKRYSSEVIGWITFGNDEKAAVMRRIEKLNTQILEGKFLIESEDELKAGMRRLSVPFDPALSPYCWLHNLLKKAHYRVDSLSGFGVSVRPDFAGLSLSELERRVEKEIIELTQAHADRYRVA